MSAPRYVLAPALTREPRGSGWLVRNPRIGTRIELGDLFDFLLEHYERPNTLEPLLERLGGTADDPPAGLEVLLSSFMLLPEADRESLGHGLLNPVHGDPIGVPTKVRELRSVPGASFAVIGAPWSAGGSATSRCATGPAELRRAFRGLSVALRGPGEGGASAAPAFVNDFEFRRRYPAPPIALDLGDVVVKGTQALEHAGRRLSVAAGLALDAGLIPVTLGGDHSVSYYTIHAVLQRTERLGVIHFDAHHDTWPPVQDQLLSHANPFHFLLQEPGLVRLHQLGVRVADLISTADEVTEDPKMSYYSALELHRMSARDALACLPRDLPYYLTFDVDCLAPHWCPSTDTPEAGGLSYYTALELLDHAARQLSIVGIDFVETGGTGASANNPAAAAAARLLFSTMMATTPFVPLTGTRIARPASPAQVTRP